MSVEKLEMAGRQGKRRRIKGGSGNDFVTLKMTLHFATNFPDFST